MTRWGVRIARAQEDEEVLHILWVGGGAEQKDAGDLTWEVWGAELLEKEPAWKCIEDALSDCGTMEIHLCKVATRSRHLTVLSVERELAPSLLLVGRHDSARDGSMTGRLARELLDEVQSAILVLRLGNLDNEEQPSPKILVPSAGGRHSRLGMRLASRMAGKDAIALNVEPDTDALSLEVGYETLRRSIRRAGIDPEDIQPKVVLAHNIFDAISREIQSGEYGLLLIGATDAGTLRRKLFGTVPERLMKGDESMCVGVIRAARPVGHRIRERLERALSLTVPQLSRDERVKLFAEIHGKARWSFDFAVLMILSTAIAGLGLLADSAAVVIGAMLVAPLMTPLLGGGLAVVQGNWPLWKQCQKSVLLGFFSALCIGGLLGLIARSIGMGLTSELLARGEPTPLDLGVAFVSGIAASYCLARPKLSSALAGVAIAAALVPPIATTGISLALGEQDLAKGSALLFGTNVVAIVLGSSLNFFIAGVRGKQATPRLWAQRLVILLALVCAGLFVPLASVLVSKLSRAEPIEHDISGALEKQGGYRVVSVYLTRGKADGGEKQVLIHLEGEGFPTQSIMKQLRRIAVKHYGEDVKVRIQMTLVKEVGNP